MQNIKVILFSFVLFASLSASAGEWRAVVQRAGFLGKFAAGASYEFSPEHAVDYFLGFYQIDKEDFFQSNLLYRYSRWNIPFYGNIWRPLQYGVFATYAMNQNRFFLKSPSKYPEANYYDETAFRYGVEFSSTFTFIKSKLGIGYHVRIFDTGVIAAFNNSRRDLQYYTSSGISLQYVF